MLSGQVTFGDCENIVIIKCVNNLPVSWLNDLQESLGKGRGIHVKCSTLFLLFHVAQKKG